MNENLGEKECSNLKKNEIILHINYPRRLSVINRLRIETQNALSYFCIRERINPRLNCFKQDVMWTQLINLSHCCLVTRFF